MSFIWYVRRLVVRRLAREWVRAVLLVAGIALGVSIAVAIVAAGSEGVRSFESAMGVLTDDSILEVRSRTGKIREESVVRWDREIRQRLIPFVEYEARLRDESSFPLLGLDPLAFDVSYEVERQIGSGLSLLVTERLRRMRDLQIGGEYQLLIGGKELLVRIAGIIPESDEIRSAVPFGLAHIGSLQRALSSEGNLSGLWIKSRSEEVRANIRAHMISSDASLAIRSKGERREEGRRLLSAFRTNISLLVVIALAVCVLTVYNSTALSMTRIRDEVATLRTLGASPNLCAAIFLIEPLFLGVAGTVVGLTLGRPGIEYVMEVILATVATLYREPTTAITFNAGPEYSLWLPFAVGVGVALSGAMVPILSVSRIRPYLVRPLNITQRVHGSSSAPMRGAFLIVLVGILLYLSQELEDVSLSYAAAIVLLAAVASTGHWLLTHLTQWTRSLLISFGRATGLIAVSNLHASSSTHGVSLAAGAIGVAVLISIGVLITSFRTTLSSWIERSIVADLYVRSESEGIAPEAVARIASLPDVAEVYQYSEMTISDEEGQFKLAGVSLDIAERRSILPLLQGDFPRQGDQALVSEALMRKRGIAIGDSILVRRLRSQSSDMKVRVVGITQDFSYEQGLVLVDRERFVNFSESDVATSLSIFLRTGGGEREAKSRIEVALGRPELVVQNNEELRALILSIFDETFRVTGVLRLIVALICAGGVVLSFRQLKVERQGMTRSLFMLGAAPGTMRDSMVIESAVLSIAIAISGVFAGLCLSGIVVYFINPLAFGWTLLLDLRAVDVLLPAAMIAVACVAGAWGAAVLSRDA